MHPQFKAAAAREAARGTAGNDVTPPARPAGGKPRILAYYGGTTGYQPRGDHHGYIGIARELARELDAELVSLDMPALRRMYRAPQANVYSDSGEEASLLRAYFSAHPLPDILLSRDTALLYTVLGDRLWQDIPLRVDAINEMLPRNFIGKKADQLQLVPHHLTPALLQAAGEAFDRAHPDVAGTTLIGYLMTDLMRMYHLPRLVRLAAQEEGNVTIFVCSCHRTHHSVPASVTLALQAEINALGVQERIGVKVFNFQQERAANNLGANPYTGILARAQHLVIEAGSQSIMSEALAAGKSIHVVENNPYYLEALFKAGLAVDLEDKDLHCLYTVPVTAPDVTATVAQSIARSYRHTLAAQAVSLPRHHQKSQP